MADESGDRGGGGYGGGRDRGEGSDAPDFSGYGGGWGNPETDFEHEIDRVNRANELADLMSDRLGERPGRFGVSSIVEQGFWDRALGIAKAIATDLAMGALKSIPGLGPVLGIGVPGVIGKIQGKSDDDINRQAFGGFIGNIVPGAGTVAAFGKSLGEFASWAGATGNPDVSFGQDAEKGRSNIDIGPGLGRGGTGPDNDVVGGGQTDFAQAGQPFKFSDGSTLIMDPKAVASQQPKVVGLRQVARPNDDREQIDQLLRRARAGRIS